MTTQFTVPFRAEDRFTGDPGYAFYGVLCSRFSENFSRLIHEQNTALIHQYVLPGPAQQPGEWRIFCHSETAASEVRGALRSPAFEVRGVPVTLSAASETILPEGAELEELAEKRFGESRIYNLDFLTASTFRQAGVHVMFPSVPLICQSLLSRRADVTGTRLEDGDALAALENGMHISAYRLESSYFPMKDGSVAGFRGRVTLTLRLAEPMRLFARSLFCLAERTGIGAKTTLGMGGVTVSSPAFRAKRE